jgi:amino acid adenylation domain-containing protein
MNESVDLRVNYGRETIDDTTKWKQSAITFSTNHITNSKQQHFEISKELGDKLLCFCRGRNVNVFDILLPAFRILLHRYNNTTDIEAMRLTGSNVLSWCAVSQSDISGEMPFPSFVAETQSVIGANEKKALPDAGKIMFIVHDDATAEISVDGTDLVFAIDAISLEGIVRFNCNIHTPEAIAQLAAHYNQLLLSIISEPHQRIGTLPMLTEMECNALLHEFNNTARPYAADETVVGLFEQQVRKAPTNIALYLGDSTLSYNELNQRANQLARHLIEQGVKPNDNVALVVNRDFNMMIGMYAILKCGAAYVPITPDTPEDRQLYMLRQSDVKFILASIGHTLHHAIGGLVSIDMGNVDYGKYSLDNLGLHIKGTHLAYTIYTSGSTGEPKGVMIEHHSVTNLVTWVNTTYNVGASDRLLFITSMGFDLSVYDIFGMLAAGGGLVIAQKEEVPNANKISELLQRFQITFWDSVPSTMEHLVNRLSAVDKSYRQNWLRIVFLSGDWIPVRLPEKISTFFTNAKVISLGGATEGTVWSNFYPVEEPTGGWRSIPYGRPIANNSFYILNEQLQPVPYGVAGELYIGGVGVARGYANDPVKTDNSFVADPFTSQWGGRMYRTGDLGRMLPGGIMEFVGRKDSQVKIRGHRVELGEIESVIRQNKSISSVVVLLSEDKQQLVSYVVPEKYYDRDTVIAQLKKKLPGYMIPAKWVELTSMPLTANGKMDTKSLLRPDSQEPAKREFAAARNELEIVLVAVWQEVMQLDGISIDDNFFDLGGQSLLAVELVTEMEKKISKGLPVNILYKCPTISQLSTFIHKEAEGKKWKSLVTIKATGNKIPMYIVHGDGLSLSNFQNLAEHVDPEQPIFSLQPIGLNGAEEPLNSISEIARHYISEILEHNPEGPYALGGYSFGGYVAIEMKKQLDQMGKRVKMLAIFDTNAENVVYKKNWVTALPKRIKRQLPKFMFIAKSMVTRPLPTIQYQYTLFSKKFATLFYSLGIKEKPKLKGADMHINKINETHSKAFRDYHLAPFNDKVHLFRAKSRMYFVDDFEYLGWADYATQGVQVYEVPGEHSTIFDPPNVGELARSLQYALDNC